MVLLCFYLPQQRGQSESRGFFPNSYNMYLRSTLQNIESFKRCLYFMFNFILHPNIISYFRGRQKLILNFYVDKLSLRCGVFFLSGQLNNKCQPTCVLKWGKFLISGFIACNKYSKACVKKLFLPTRLQSSCGLVTCGLV